MKTADQFQEYSFGHAERLPKQDEKTGAVFSGQVLLGERESEFFLVPKGHQKEGGAAFIIVLVSDSGRAVRFGHAGYRQDNAGQNYLYFCFQHQRFLRTAEWFNAWPDEEQPKDIKEPAYYSLKPGLSSARRPDAGNDFAGLGNGIF